MTEMEFLESLNKEQAEYYAKSIDELCEMLGYTHDEFMEMRDAAEEARADVGGCGQDGTTEAEPEDG